MMGDSDDDDEDDDNLSYLMAGNCGECLRSEDDCSCSSDDYSGFCCCKRIYDSTDVSSDDDIILTTEENVSYNSQSRYCRSDGSDDIVENRYRKRKYNDVSLADDINITYSNDGSQSSYSGSDGKSSNDSDTGNDVSCDKFNY
jgi:hypothetical protein